MGKVSSAKKQREKKKLDKISERKRKEEKMRSVLTSLAVIADESKTKESKKSGQKNQATPSENATVIDKEAMYKEMRSSKIMKRKWKVSNQDRGPKPIKEGESEGEDVSESADEDYDRKM